MNTPWNNSAETTEALTVDLSRRREFLKSAGNGIAALGVFSVTGSTAFAADAAPGANRPVGANNFHTNDKVTIEKVAFKNQYQMAVAGNLFLPKDSAKDAKLPAVVVGHPMGAVKEQSADLYATKMAEQGFVALSGHRDDFAAPVALQHGRPGAFEGVQRRCLPAGRRAEGTVHRSWRRPRRPV